MDETILLNYLQGECNDEEAARVETWCEEEPGNRKTLEQLYYTLFVGERIAVMNAIDTEASLDKFKSAIREKEKKTKRKNISIRWGRYATVAAAFLTGAAYHNYGGRREELNTIQQKRPDKELIFTETSIGMWNDGRNLEKRLMEDMEETALGTVNNWCKAVIVWNLMLDNERGPNREGGCQTCYGAVDIDRSDYKTITRNSHYYIIGHLSSVVKPGAVRIGSKGYTADGIMYSAFENLDGTEALVLLNNTDEAKNITVNSGERSFTYEVPAKAVASFRWNLY